MVPHTIGATGDTPHYGVYHGIPWVPHMVPMGIPRSGYLPIDHNGGDGYPWCDDHPDMISCMNKRYQLIGGNMHIGSLPIVGM